MAGVQAMGSPSVDERAARWAAQAVQLRQAAAGLRRLAGRLTYHPGTGRHPRATPGILGAIAGMDQIVSEIQQGAEERAMDLDAVTGAPERLAKQVRRSHADVDAGTQAVLAALHVLRGLLDSPGEASVDAPYGLGAPARHHPGALCTIAAAHAEGVAQALETAAVARANIGG